jgi:hypothetical protein
MANSRGKVIKGNFGNNGKLPTLKEKLIDENRRKHAEIRNNVAKILQSKDKDK